MLRFKLVGPVRNPTPVPVFCQGGCGKPLSKNRGGETCPKCLKSKPLKRKN